MVSLERGELDSEALEAAAEVLTERILGNDWAAECLVSEDVLDGLLHGLQPVSDDDVLLAVLLERSVEEVLV